MKSPESNEGKNWNELAKTKIEEWKGKGFTGILIEPDGACVPCDFDKTNPSGLQPWDKGYAMDEDPAEAEDLISIEDEDAVVSVAQWLEESSK